MKRLAMPVIFILGVLVSYLLTYSPYSVARNSSLQILVAPGSATVKVNDQVTTTVDSFNGQALTVKKLAVKPGNYVITVSQSGFATATRRVTAQASQSAFVGVVLQPNSPNTQDWYATHSYDELLLQGIGSHESDYQAQLATRANPFLKQLPLLYGDGQGGIVTIAQGIPVTKGGPPAVYVTADSAAARQNALTYMESRGFNPATMDIIFTSQSNPLGGVNGG